MSDLREIAQAYAQKYDGTIRSRTALKALYPLHISRGETNLLDAAAATAAVNALILSDQIDQSAITHQLHEAFELVFPGHSIDELNGIGPDQAQGWLSAWKGKYFEVLVRDRLNAGERVGDIQLNPGQTAALADDPAQPGWDLRILEIDGGIAEELQLKATDSVSYVKKAIEKYPDVNVATTEEVASKMDAHLDGVEVAEETFTEQAIEEVVDGVISTGIADSTLERTVIAPMEDLLDSPLEEIAETVLPFLPFVLIGTMEGGKLLIGRQSFEHAVRRSFSRGAKTGASMLVGGMLALVGAGLLSLPATFLTRIGIDRVVIGRGLSKRLERRIQVLSDLAVAS